MDKITSYDEYCEALDGRGDIILFRGQPVSDFVLIPSGLRAKHIQTADMQMFRFVDEMQKVFGYDELTCIEIAQHFSLHTRLLDFSYSYTVALFFACFDAKGRYGDRDGKVYVFNKSRYEWLLKKNGKNSTQVNKNNEYLYKWLQHYVDKSDTRMGDDGLDMPIFIEAGYDSWGGQPLNDKPALKKKYGDRMLFTYELDLGRDPDDDTVKAAVKGFMEDFGYDNRGFDRSRSAKFSRELYRASRKNFDRLVEEGKAVL